jgi:hypothetical protein
MTDLTEMWVCCMLVAQSQWNFRGERELEDSFNGHWVRNVELQSASAVEFPSH